MPRVPTLFFNPMSPPARTVLVTSKEIGLELDVQHVDMVSMEHRNANYLKINPVGQIPTLRDEENTIRDSHAIAIYLVEKYARNDSLYPKDIIMRTKINQMLFFESSMLFLRYYELVVPIFRRIVSEFSELSIANLKRTYELLNGFFVDDQKYLCGDHLTLADINIWSTMLSLNFMVPVDEEKCPKLVEWLKLMEKRPTYEINVSGAKKHSEFIKALCERRRDP